MVGPRVGSASTIPCCFLVLDSRLNFGRFEQPNYVFSERLVASNNPSVLRPCDEFDPIRPFDTKQHLNELWMRPGYLVHIILPRVLGQLADCYRL